MEALFFGKLSRLILQTIFTLKVKKDSYFKELDFSAQLVQSLPTHHQDFKCF